MKRYKHSLSSLFLLQFLAIRSSAEELTLNVNFKQPVSVTDEKFLSLTVDPSALVHGNALSTDFERSISLAKALAPAYIRLGGPRGTFYQSTGQDPQDDEGNQNSVLSETEWVLAHQWAEKAGLDVIACITPESVAKEQERSSENLGDLTNIVSFSDHMRLDANWQLGYECQTRCNISASDLARRVVQLRKILDAFPRYSKSIVIGPDVVAYATEEQRQYLRDYFNYAVPALSAITWHPDLDSISFDNDGVLVYQDNLEQDKEELYKVIGRFAKRRPLWIAESKAEGCKNLYLGALVLARRLGNAAKSKVDVVMRQPSDLTQPTPDYWVSLLHKNFVGRRVFDANVQSLNKSHVYLYCQCTKASSSYDRGAVTIFGVNLSPENVQIDLKGTKITTLHEYILSPGFDAPNRMFSESILLNNETLTLVNNTVPDVKPVILKDPKGLALNLHSGGIGFWVLPELQIKSCMEPQQVLEPQNRRSNIRVPRDARGKVRGTRSLQDRGNARSERKKERDDSRVARQPDAKRELKRLRIFVKKELNDYDARRSRNIGETSNPKVENGLIRRVKSVGENSEPRDDTQTKLQEFKDRFTRISDLIKTNRSKAAIGSSLNNTVTETLSQISKVQDALEAAKQETDYTSKVKASNSVKEHLKHLHDLLTRGNSTDSNDSLVSKEDKSERREKRAKRDLVGRIAIPSWDLNRGRLLRKRSWPEDVKERRTHPRFGTREDVRVQPRVVELGTSDSGENTFYGFFKTNPVEGFPEGNVFFATDDQPHSNSYGYTRGGAARATDYDDAEYDYDQRYYESVESIEKPSVPNPRVTPAELWEAETYERQGNSKSEEERDVEPDEQQETTDNQSYLRRLTGYYVPRASRNDRTNSYDKSNVRSGRFRRTPATAIKLNDQTTKISDHKAPFMESVLSIDGDVEDSKRAKRGSTDLYTVLDQEMINEDDANSRDCNCRVIRRSKPCIHRLKRDVSTPVEYETNTDLVPQQEISVDSRGSDADTSDSNFRDTDVEVFSELGASPLEILQLQTEPSNLKIEPNAEAPLQIELNSGTQEILTERESIEAHTESSGSWLDSSSTSSLNLDEDLDSSLKTDVRRDGSTFFRGEAEKPAINNFEDTAGYTSSSRENSTPVAEENDAETGEPTKEIQASRAETSGTTLDPASVSKDIAKGPENDHNNDTVARGSVKRQVEGESPADTPSTAERERKGLSTQLASNSKSKKERAEYSSSRRAALNEKRARKMEMLRNAKTLLTLKRMIDKEKGRQTVEPTTLRASNKIRQFAQRGVPVTEVVRPRNVKERIFHPKNQKNFRQSAIMKRSHPTNLMEEIIQLRDLYENVAERGERFDDNIGGTDKSYLALVEDLESPRIFRYQQQPLDGQKINLQVLSPRSRFGSKCAGNSPQQRPYQQNLDIIQRSREEGEEESDELPVDREVYILDPSKYRGGQPTLQLYSDPLKPRRTNQKVISKNLYETIWQPVLYKPYKIHQAGQSNSGDETSISLDSQESEEEAENLAKLRDISSNLQAEELLEILINALDLQSAEELSKILTEQNGVGIEKRNFMRSISEDPREESQENLGRAKEESEVERKPEVSGTQEATEETENYQDALRGTKGEKGETSSGEPIAQDSGDLQVHLKGVAKLRKRRDIDGEIENDYSDWLPPLFMRKARRAIKKTGQNNNFLCLRENLGGTSDENTSKFFKIVKENEYYKAVPINKLPKELNRRILPVTRSRSNDDHPGEKIDFPGRLKIVFPPKLSDKYSSTGMVEDPTVGVKNSHVGSSVNNQEDSGSVENKSELEESGESLDDASDYVDEDTSDMLELSNTDGSREESEGESEENVNLKDLLLSEQPEVLMLLPWAKRLSRPRRQATEQDTLNENEGVEKVQPLELQQLEELSSPRVSIYNDVDDVERSMAQKRPLEKYTRKENLVANYIKERKNLGESSNDRGLPSFIEGNIPKLENVVVDGLEKVQNLTGSVEQLVEDLNEEFDETSNNDEQPDYTNAASTGIAQRAFQHAIMGVQKIFTLLSGITHILRG